jgi:hypothetical protein
MHDPQFITKMAPADRSTIYGQRTMFYPESLGRAALAENWGWEVADELMVWNTFQI